MAWRISSSTRTVKKINSQIHSGRKLTGNLRKTVSQGTLSVTSLPLCPEISLVLLSSDYPRGKLDYDEMIAIMDTPAYWAFCWASGQVLGRYILTHPVEFKDKVILDFGTGSGVVAIAAKLAGAKRAIACDIDPDALDASAANAKLNGVSIELLDDIHNLQVDPDLIIAADVLYDRDNFPWIQSLPTLAQNILIADSRVDTGQLPGYQIIDRITATTIPDLDELKEFNDVRIYRRLTDR